MAWMGIWEKVTTGTRSWQAVGDEPLARHRSCWALSNCVGRDGGPLTPC